MPLETPDHRHVPPRLAIWLCWTQGLYFAATGLWPLISIRTFQAVTGEKTDHLITGREADHWLVNTVAVLVLACSAVFLFDGWRRRPSLQAGLLAMAAATGLALVDVVYVARGTILPIYLADAAAEIVFVMLWLWCWQGLREANT